MEQTRVSQRRRKRVKDPYDSFEAAYLEQENSRKKKLLTFAVIASIATCLMFLGIMHSIGEMDSNLEEVFSEDIQEEHVKSHSKRR